MSAIHFHQNERGTIDSAPCAVEECPRLVTVGQEPQLVSMAPRPCGCIPGQFLCPTAEYLWARVGSAHRARDYAEYNSWRVRYDEHFTPMHDA